MRILLLMLFFSWGCIPQESINELNPEAALKEKCVIYHDQILGKLKNLVSKDVNNEQDLSDYSEFLEVNSELMKSCYLSQTSSEKVWSAKQFDNVQLIIAQCNLTLAVSPISGRECAKGLR